MKTYIQSRGYSPNHDYIWVVEQEPQQVEEVINTKLISHQDIPILNEAVKLINTKDFAVVLFREQGQLLLIVTGLRTRRKDSQNRYIYNSIAWTGTDKDEPILRKITALTLENKFQIPESAVFNLSDSSFGFEVNWDEIKALMPKTGAENAPLYENQKSEKIAFFSEDRNKDLANELMTYSLPLRDGALVVVTEFEQSKQIFKEAKVWRGISKDQNIIYRDAWEKLLSKPGKDIAAKKDEIKENINIIDEEVKLLTEDVQTMLSKLLLLLKIF
ncbi:hypothetical protein [Nostoc sp.]|uniref:hypothetical protein n=1 Tax=Nostoc sp. TaxID=1180 RepID=UPI002FF702DD